MRYLGIADLNSPETRAAVEKTFSDFKTAQIATAPVTTAAVIVAVGEPLGGTG
jgi:hypothetical protein